MLKKIFIVGAGQLGSRHLQSLKAVKIPLDITVVDPSNASLRTAQERYGSIAGENHRVIYVKEIPALIYDIDIAIIPSTADVRRQIIEKLLKSGKVKYMVMEKLLFTRKDDYFRVQELLYSQGVRAWVNCSMRTMPFYAGLQPLFKGTPFIYTVKGSSYGLITNSIHYIDHIAYLSGESNYELDSGLLEYPPIASKRPGFLELNGTLAVNFANGCRGIFTCFSEGTLPVMVEIVSPGVRVISKEWEGKALISKKSDNWEWTKTDSTVLYQSQMTAGVVTDVLTKGTCNLVGYDESMKEHLILLEGLLHFLNGKSNPKKELYPFT